MDHIKPPPHPAYRRLRALRQERGWSIRRAASESGVSAARIGSYERGDRNATVDGVDEYAAAYQHHVELAPDDLAARLLAAVGVVPDDGGTLVDAALAVVAVYERRRALEVA